LRSKTNQQHGGKTVVQDGAKQFARPVAAPPAGRRRSAGHAKTVGFHLGVVWLLMLGTAQAQTTVPSAASPAPAAKQVVAPVQAPPFDARPSPAAPTWTFLRLIKLPNPGAASLDRRGALYVADADNNLRQYGPEGLVLNTYAPTQPGHIAQVEAWNITSILVFNDDRQQLVLLDRFLTPITEARLADYVDGMVRTATLAPDNHIWLLDESNLVLREFDPATLRLVQNTPLDLIIGRARPDFRFLRQYQNNTYLVDRNTGIYVFDNLGTYKKKMPFVGLSTVGFRGDELYYFDAGAVHFFHLYNLSERRVTLPTGVEPSSVRQVLVGESYAYVFTPAGVSVYQFK
jgi:hypothetical protein